MKTGYSLHKSSAPAMPFWVGFEKRAADMEQQTVIVHKTHAKDRKTAQGIARGFARRMYTSRETSTSYRFRQRPPGHFVEGSFRTKKTPKKGVTIVYGKLKENSDA